MAVWILAPLAAVGAKIIWNSYKFHINNPVDLDLSTPGNAPRYCDINTILTKYNYPTIAPSSDLVPLTKINLFIGSDLLSAITKHLQDFYEISAMKKLQAEEIAASITLHNADCASYLARRSTLEKDMSSLKMLNAKINLLKADITEYDQMFNKLSGNLFKKIGNLFNSQDALDAKHYQEMSSNASQRLSSYQFMSADLEQSIKDIKAIDTASRLFNAIEAKHIYPALLNEIESIDSAFNLGIEQLVLQIDNLTCISETTEQLQPIFNTLNSTQFKSILNIIYTEVEPGPNRPRHKLENYGYIKPLIKLLHEQSKNILNIELLTDQIKTIANASKHYQALQDNIDSALAQLPIMKQSYQHICEKITTVHSEEHDLKAAFDEYNASIAAKIENFESISTSVKALNDFGFDHEVEHRNAELTKLQKDLVRNNEMLDDIQMAIGDLESEIAANEEKINICSLNILTLKKYQQDLSDAENTYEKSMIHKEINEKFGDSNPRRLVQKSMKIKDASLRAIDKQKEKIKDIIFNMTMPISDILIDGNNCCYFNGNQLLGLSAIKAIIPQLCLIAKVTIVFDHTVIKRVNKTENDIRQELLFDNVDISIAPKGEIADNFLNMMANTKPESIIISNDGFQEFTGDKKRIRNHMITKDMIMIHSLNISAEF